MINVSSFSYFYLSDFINDILDNFLYLSISTLIVSFPLSNQLFSLFNEAFSSFSVSKSFISRNYIYSLINLLVIFMVFCSIVVFFFNYYNISIIFILYFEPNNYIIYSIWGLTSFFLLSY